MSDIYTSVRRHATDLVVAYLAWYIAYLPSDTLELAQIVLAVKLNVFALPLIGTQALDIPIWVLYVISVLWIRQALYYSSYSTSDISRQIDSITGGSNE
jgi:hypothetical protein